MNYVAYKKLIDECVTALMGDSCSDFTRSELNKLITIAKVVPENICKKWIK